MVDEMLTVNSTDVRKDFGTFIDNVTRKKPIVVKRSRDLFMGISITMMEELLRNIKFEFNVFIEEDKSYTLSLDSLSIAVNARTYEETIDLLISNVKEYCSEYYEDLDFWHSAPNRKSHFPYVIKTLVSESDEELKKDFICLAGQI